ncbi:MAG: endopeptidase La [Lachnospiraceae bacterium]|nr:endopeptidase La [Lachnospiraceae bacterium]
MEEEIKERMPAVALTDCCILPDMLLAFEINRTSSTKAIEKAMEGEKKLFMTKLVTTGEADPDRKDVCAVGTIVRIRQVTRPTHGGIQLMVEGLCRARLLSVTKEEEGYKTAEVMPYAREGDVLIPAEEEACLRALKDLLSAYDKASHQIGGELLAELNEMTDLNSLVDQASIEINTTPDRMQKLLEAISLRERYAVLTSILATEVDVLGYRDEVQAKIQKSVDKNQREYLLREQLKFIQNELGEDPLDSDAASFLEKCEKLEASDEVKDKIREEISRFQNMQAMSPESQVVRGYIETLLSLPWDKRCEDSKDLTEAEAILNRDHYGLDDVKERILEYLAVRQMTGKGDSPVLCLVGPPGTGKTSIGRSVAEATHRPYVRLSLGGVRDEAEIRGHRRTYIGAMPGRIVNALKKAGVKNPLVVLDEIDKVSSDYKGDVASALLEVLDTEQNSHFEDHYVELPVDLSEVMFLTTANDIQSIPGPLLDRMEVIEISSYTANEKFHIAKEHLVPKQIEKNGLQNQDFRISNSALTAMIASYTREAGVRSLERQIGKTCRKAALEILKNGKKSVRVTEKSLKSYLGNPRYEEEKANQEAEVGIVRGLAWASVGGVTLEIEVNILPGAGELVLTGQLGDVMKESATTALSYVRSIADDYGVAKDFFKEHDIHLHIPEGAVPKDGPSAGITMATGILSAVANIPVRPNVAMTGEITLRGNVLPIGGLKEKLLAAATAGITDVLVPEKNRPDVLLISKEITGRLAIHYMKTMREVLEESLVQDHERNT